MLIRWLHQKPADLYLHCVLKMIYPGSLGWVKMYLDSVGQVKNAYLDIVGQFKNAYLYIGIKHVFFMH